MSKRRGGSSGSDSSDSEEEVLDASISLALGALTLEPDAPQVLEVDFHPHRALFATADVAGVVRMYQLARPQPKIRGVALPEHRRIGEFDHHTASCRSVLFHPTTGAHAYTASADKSIGIIDTETMKLALHQREAHACGINKLAFYSENLLVSGDDDGFVNVWDLRAANAKVMPTKPLLRHLLHYQDAGDYISDIYPMPDKNRLLITSGDGHLYVYDMRAGHIHEMVSGKGAKKNEAAKAKGSKKSESGARLASGGVVDTWFAMSDDVDDELSGVVSLKNGKKICVAGREEGVLNIFKYDFFGIAEDHFVLSAAGNSDEGSGASIDCMLKIDEDTVITGSTDGLIRLVQVHPNKLLSILGTHEDFPIETMKMSPPVADYWLTALAPEPKPDDDNDDDGEEDEDDSDKKLSKSEASTENKPIGGALIPRFLATSSHDQTIKFWNCSELFEVDPDEVRPQEEESSDEDDNEDEDDDTDGEKEAPKANLPLKKASLLARKLAAAPAATAATSTSSDRKRKRDVDDKPAAAAAGASKAADSDDAMSDGNEDGDGGADDNDDMSDSSQFDLPMGNTNSDEDAADDGEDGEDYGEDDQDEYGEDDEEDDGAGAENDAYFATNKRVKRDAPAKVSSAWADLVSSSTSATADAALAAPAPAPVIKPGTNPFAAIVASTSLAAPTAASTNPFAIPSGSNPFAIPSTAASTNANPFAIPATSGSSVSTPFASTATSISVAFPPSTTPAAATTAANPFAAFAAAAAPATSPAAAAAADPAAAASPTTPATSAAKKLSRWLKVAAAPSATAAAPVASAAPAPAAVAAPASDPSPALDRKAILAAKLAKVKKLAVGNSASIKSVAPTAAAPAAPVPATAKFVKPRPGKCGYCCVCTVPANNYCLQTGDPVCGMECKKLNLAKDGPKIEAKRRAAQQQMMQQQSATSTSTPPAAAKSAAARIAPTAPSSDDDSESDDDGAHGGKAKVDLNANTKFFEKLPANHPMHPSQAHKRAARAGLQLEEDNIAKRGEKKRAQLQEKLARLKAKKARHEAKKADAVARGEDPDMVSESEDEDEKPTKGRGGAKKKAAKDSDESDDSDDSDASEAPKERKLTPKERKAKAKAEKKRNPFFAGLA